MGILTFIIAAIYINLFYAHMQASLSFDYNISYKATNQIAEFMLGYAEHKK